jgi:hypothetical protein
LRAGECRINGTQEISPDKGNGTLEEVLRRENWLKVASTFIVEYIKAGEEWKVLKQETIETKKIE